jgi:transposase
MPYAYSTHHIPMPRDKDRRVKLTDEDRATIKANPDGLSQRKLAAAFGVSRRLVTFILDPAKRAGNLAARKARGGSTIYYDRKTHTKAVREHRRYKQRVLHP